MTTLAAVMPVFNGGRWIDRSLASVASQTHPIGSIVVVDDCSTDDTPERLAEWAQRLPLRVVRNERNLGIGESLRRGVASAGTDWILRIDADDAWLPEHVGCIEASISGHGSAVLVSSGARLVDEQGRRLREQMPPGEATVRASLMWDNPLVHSATAFSRLAYERVGGYRPSTRWEDYDLWIRLLQVGGFAAIDRVTMEYTVAARSLSRVRRVDSIRGRWECQRRAIGAFGRLHPARATRCLVLGGLRLAIARWR